MKILALSEHMAALVPASANAPKACLVILALGAAFASVLLDARD